MDCRALQAGRAEELRGGADMSVKENRPDVCATFGTANPICRNDTTDTRLGQVPYAVPLSLTSTSALMGSRIIAASSASLTTMC